ncbi:unnamed protein product [Caenorhabditis brenneri]
MPKSQPVNWTLIQDTCPEFTLNHWDIIAATIAFFGATLNFFLMFYFKKTAKVAVFLPNLAGIDWGICCLFLWQYFYPALMMYFQWSLLAEVRVAVFWHVEMVRDYFDLIMTFLMFCIIFEKFLWTCSSSTRHTWRIFVIGKYKFWTLAAFTLLSGLAAYMHNFHMLQLSKVPFCDVVFLPIPFQDPALQFIQIHIISLINEMFIALIFVFIVLTLRRFLKAGEGNKPIGQDDEVDLDNQEGHTLGEEDIARIKLTNKCMVIVCCTYLLRSIAKPNTFDIAARNRHEQYMKMWGFDCFTMLISTTRIAFYYMVCRLDFVAEYPASGQLK